MVIRSRLAMRNGIRRANYRRLTTRRTASFRWSGMFISVPKAENWNYATPELAGKVTTVGIGVDGTCMLICDQKWREAMTGSLSLYDKHGERLHTIYVGAAPEYGKETFFNRMMREIDHVKSLYPRAHFVGIADGARSNW